MKLRIIVLVGCAALLGYLLGLRSSQKAEPLQIAHESDRPVAVLGDHSSAPERSPRSIATPELQMPRYESPRAAALEWVEEMKRGDVDAVARSIMLTSGAKNTIEKAMASAPAEFTRKYPTPELLTAFVFCGAQKVDGFQIEAERLVQPDYAVLEIAYKFESEPQWRREGFGFQRTSDGWKSVVGDALSARIAAIVSGAKR